MPLKTAAMEKLNWNTSTAPILFSPYYQEYQNFEPWDNNKVEIPANYDYDWQSGVYDCEYLSQ